MKPQVLSTRDADEFFTEELCHILERSNSSEDPELSIAQARVGPGVTTRWHALEGITERYLILSGRGRVELGDALVQDLSPGEVALIPPGCPQRIFNPGPEDLVFLALCTPRFRPEVYRALE